MPDIPLKISLFLPSLRGGGAERVMLTLAHYLALSKVDVDLVLVNTQGPYLKGLPSNVNIVNLGARRVITSLPSLVMYIRKERPFALLSTMTHCNVLALVAKVLSGVPIRILVRESNTPKHDFSLKSFFYRIFAFFLYPHADFVIAVSQAMASGLKKKYRGISSKIVTVYNPVIDRELFRLASLPANHPWFELSTIPIILAAGRLVPQKDYKTLLIAFADVVKEIPCRLIILGEGPERNKLEQLIVQLGLKGCVDLPGFMDNPFCLMARANVFVLSSAWEGLPNVLIQALALGTPVVSTDCYSGPSEILEGGRYGELVPVGDSAAMARAIKRCLIEQGKTHCSDEWRLKFSVNTVANIYLQLIKGERGR